MTYAAPLLYSSRVFGPLPRGPVAAVLVSLLVAGCAHAPTPLDFRVDPVAVGLDARRAAAVTEYNDLADRLQAVAGHYDEQVGKNHLKLRLMGVLSAVSVATAAGLVPPAVHPEMPDFGRRLLATFSVSLAANGVVFGLVPHAHQYFLKEVGYQRQAHAARGAYSAVATDCGPTRLADPDSVPESLDACVNRMRDALDDALRFEVDSPCKPPTAEDLGRRLDAARDARAR